MAPDPASDPPPDTAPRRRVDAAVLVLTGGASTRMGGHKPSLEVGGRPVVVRVIEAAGELPVLVVGRGDDVPSGIRQIPDERAGGGPVAGIAAGLSGLVHDPRGKPGVVVVLAGDLPFVTRAHLQRLVAALDDRRLDDGDAVGRPALAVTVDAGGRLNWLCSAWRLDDLQRRLDRLGDPHGQSMRALAEGLRRVTVTDADACVDIDTPDDLERARNRACDAR